MFGVSNERLIAGLEELRKRVCEYGPLARTCDCKFGASGEGEQSGCPELRQAIEYLKGNFDEVHIFGVREKEQKAQLALGQIRKIIDATIETT
jgi:hypothetical protein